MMRAHWKRRLVLSVAGGLLAVAPATARAGGLAVNEASARLTGTGYAGTTGNLRTSTAARFEEPS